METQCKETIVDSSSVTHLKLVEDLGIVLVAPLGLDAGTVQQPHQLEPLVHHPLVGRGNEHLRLGGSQLPRKEKAGYK